MWQPADTRFYIPRHPVTVIAIGDSGEALLIRSLLESLDAVVHLHLIGAPADFLHILRDGGAAPYVVLSCHGDDHGIVFGDYIPEIDTSMLLNGSLPPHAIGASIALPDRILINTGCFTGAPVMAAAFMAGGLAAYIAARGAPHGSSIALFIHHFFHTLFHRNTSPRAAWRRAAAYDDDSRQFVLYDPAGCHQIEV